MIRRLVRWLVRWLAGPWGRRLGIAALIAVAWLWWAWVPLRPITAWTSPQTDSNWYPTWPRISRDGSTFVEISDQLPFGTDPFANGSMAGPVRLWDLPAGRERVRIPGVDKTALRAVLGPDGGWVMIWTPFHRGLSLWDGRTGKRLTEMRPPDAPDEKVIHPTPFLASDDGKFVACGFGLNPPAIRMWETATGRWRLTSSVPGRRSRFRWMANAFWPRRPAKTTGPAPSPNSGTSPPAANCSRFPATVGRSGRWRSAPTAGCWRPGWTPIIMLPNPATSLDVKLWDAATGQLVQSFSVKAGLSLAFSPDSRLLLVWGMRARGLVWDITETPPQNRDDLIALTEEVVKGTPQLSSHYGPQYAPAGKAWYVTDKDGTTIAAAGEPTESPRPLSLPRVLGVASRMQVNSWPHTAVFSPGGQVLAVPVRADVPYFRLSLGGLIDRVLRRRVGSQLWSTVRVFDPRSGRVFGTLPPVTGECYVLGFTPDEQTFWTERFLGDRNGPRSAMTRVFEQWAVPEPGIPTWLIGVTAAASLLVAGDWYARRRRFGAGVLPALESGADGMPQPQ